MGRPCAPHSVSGMAAFAPTSILTLPHCNSATSPYLYVCVQEEDWLSQMVERLWPYLRQAIEKLAWEMLPGESLLLHVTRQHAIRLPLWQQCEPCTVLLAGIPACNRSCS